MMKVGLTGGIGVGKSIVSTVFSVLKIPVYEADSKAKVLMQSDKQLMDELIDAFGQNIFIHNQLIPSILAQIVFNDRKALSKVNSIVHPYVMQDFITWTQSHSDDPYVIMESAILIESGLCSHFDKIICITSPLKMRIERIRKRDGISEDLVKQRISNQLSDKEKLPKCDYIIYNDDNSMVLPQVLDIHNQLLKVTN
jgi:dephospho-CoA kinase